MEMLTTLFLFVAALAIILYAVLTEGTDWIGRAEIIEQRWPGLWGLMNNRPMRLILIVVALVMVGHGIQDLRGGAEPLTVSFKPPTVPTIIAPSPQTTPESANSLRRRTIKVASDLFLFWSKRPLPLQPVQNPSTDEDRKRNAVWDTYWREANGIYATEYKDRIIGIIREYKTKGIPTGYLEQAAENHTFGAWAFSVSGSPICSQDEVCELRELAYHVDANDQMIGPNF
jgi:hypothetical protein